MNKLDRLDIMLKDVKVVLWENNMEDRNITLVGEYVEDEFAIRCKLTDNKDFPVESWLLYRGEKNPLNDFIKDIIVDKIQNELQGLANKIIVR
ncbi:MAG: hypothetical protein ACRDBY_14165 [Cetobacterium sp.]